VRNLLKRLNFKKRTFGVFVLSPKIMETEKIQEIQRELNKLTGLPIEIIASIMTSLNKKHCIYEIACIAAKKAEKFRLNITPRDVYRIVSVLQEKGLAKLITSKSPDKILVSNVRKKFIAAPSPIHSKLRLPPVKPVIIPKEIAEIIPKLEMSESSITISDLASIALHMLLDRHEDILFAILIMLPLHPISLVSRENFEVTSTMTVLATVISCWNAAASYIGRAPISSKVSFILMKGNNGLMLIKGFGINQKQFIIAAGCTQKAKKKISKILCDINWIISELSEELSRVI